LPADLNQDDLLNQDPEPCLKAQLHLAPDLEKDLFLHLDLEKDLFLHLDLERDLSSALKALSLPKAAHFSVQNQVKDHCSAALHQGSLHSLDPDQVKDLLQGRKADPERLHHLVFLPVPKEGLVPR
jgi:hypothetical protein